MFLGEGVLKISSKCTGEHPYQNVISLKLQSSKNTSERAASGEKRDTPQINNKVNTTEKNYSRI